MKLSDIVNYKLAIKDVDTKSVQHEYYKFKKNLSSTLDTHDVDFGDIKSQIHSDLQKISDLLENVENNLRLFEQKLDGFIKTYEPKYYEMGQSVYQDTVNDSAEYIFERHTNQSLFDTEEDTQFFLSRLSLNTDWRHPGMHIRPLDGALSDVLKALDPLYFVDTDSELLQKVRQLWHPQYQKRLRYYTINEQDDNPLKDLPQQQFGFVLVSEFFNYKSIEVVSKYLASIYSLLKPGGVLVFTFNNCDTVEGIRQVEAKFSPYTPARKIKKIAQKLGYKIVAEFSRPAKLSWLEVRKPGELTSMRNGQTLGSLKQLSR
jgi:SAM-dependent methyltransferase